MFMVMLQPAVLILILFQLLFAVAALAGTGGNEDPIGRFTVAVPRDVLRDYALFLDGRDPLTLTDYSGPHSRRDVIEVVLFRQALALGGISRQPDFEILPSYSRILEELKTGHTVALGTPAWLADLKDSRAVFISAPIVENGQFEAGFYTAPGNLKALTANTPARIRQLSAACNRSWKADWKTLEGIGIKDIRHVSKWENMVRLVHTQRVDFLLAPFQQTDDLSLVVDDQTLIPIPGIKTELSGSRHFAISKKHPAGKRLYEALQSGLAILRQRGLLHQAYCQCGFFNARTAGWISLSAPDTASCQRKGGMDAAPVAPTGQ